MRLGRRSVVELCKRRGAPKGRDGNDDRGGRFAERPSSVSAFRRLRQSTQVLPLA
jgi:hypothetical protein